MSREPTVETLLDWAGEGQRRLEDAVGRLKPQDVRAPSALPGWTRGHLITHLARNADALVNLLTWARTGTPTPMYATPERRNTDIEAGAGRALDEQRADLRESARRFAEGAAAVPPAKWAARVKSAQGRDVSASEVPWLRVREVWIHYVDLDIGESIDVVPDDVATKLVSDVADWMSPKLDHTTDLRPEGHPAVLLGPTGEPTATVVGPANLIAGWLIGRCDSDRLNWIGDTPVLSPWL
ncbi:MAG: maleylpyruvate isomerase N-terminal domain-containing protein [Haloechinothrix sp.]